MTQLTAATREKLRGASVATISTVLFGRGLRNQVIQGITRLCRSSEQMIGVAYTLRYIPAREDLNQLEVFRNHAHPQRRAVEECPPGSVLVIDSRQNPRAASAGSILVNRLMVRGAAGIVTDGGLRDSATIAQMRIPSYHNRPSAPTNLTLHHAIDLNVPIGCGDVAVFPGDIIVGDEEGVVVIPAEIADEVAVEAARMTEYEDFVTEEIGKSRSIFGLYPATDPDALKRFELWRREKSSKRGMAGQVLASDSA